MSRPTSAAAAVAPHRHVCRRAGLHVGRPRSQIDLLLGEGHTRSEEENSYCQ